ncbi:MAG: glutamate racemase [Victivallales bacterium]|jgi:glutamate racemase|nr:glutamate racemase [Victivallales bacterium]
MKLFDNRPIGIFDSGLGGLTVAAALRRKLPGEAVVYLGDTARVPYGDKSVDSIIHFAHQDVEFMLSCGVKIVVAACNTVSAVALNSLKHDYPDKTILGVIDSGVRAVIDSGAESIAVIGTRATINSDAYRRGIHAANCAIKVESIACPLLVPLAEEGITAPGILTAVFDIYLSKLRKNPPDALLLGCTHYPLFAEALNSYFAGKVKIIDSAGACAKYTAEFLETNKIAAQPDNSPGFGCFVTDMPSEFQCHARRFLGGQLPDRVEKISFA